MTTADRFASEWTPILGVVHHSTPFEHMATELDTFVQVPADKRISAADNQGLMRAISTDEVIQAISALNRHKAAGADGLNNEFFKDAQAVLVPAMVALGNKLLSGGKPPQSFLKGLIIPLRKKGNSADAMDYKLGTRSSLKNRSNANATGVGDSKWSFTTRLCPRAADA